ncbi:MAG TPA: glycerol-3-phosphate dehydrogenase/oxidase [Polyangia bacterium]
MRPLPPSRAATLRRLADETFDVLVVGAGATGAAVARDAALRGLTVALVDRGDFAAETSSYSSKLIHGGIRYLEHGHLHLVFEALSERRRLMTTAPHLCRPVEFFLPVFRGQRPSLFTLTAGVAIYDALALFRPPVKSRRLSLADFAREAPALRTAGLVGGMGYIDCQTDDSRLVLETALDAEIAGAAVATYVEIVAPPPPRRGYYHVLRARDRASGGNESTFPIQAQLVVNATGPFSDAFRGEGRALRPTLGVHIVTDAARLPHDNHAFLIRSPRDGRVMFVLPAGPRTIVGTTDTDWTDLPRAGDSAHPIEARAEDVAYLLESVHHNFPECRLDESDVISTFAGLRPLLASDDSNPSASSREHAIWVDRAGMLSVAGGKLTTMRRMGEQVVDTAVELLRARGLQKPIGPCLTRTRLLPGGGPPIGIDPVDHHELGEDVRAHLAASFGGRAHDVLNTLAIDDGRLGHRLAPDLPYLAGEVRHAVEHEHALEVEDVLCRRVPLFRVDRNQGLAAAIAVADEMGACLGWSPAQRAASVARYKARVTASRQWSGTSR